MLDGVLDGDRSGIRFVVIIDRIVTRDVFFQPAECRVTGYSREFNRVARADIKLLLIVHRVFLHVYVYLWCGC